MAQFLFFCLLSANVFLGLAMATDKPQIMVQSMSAPASNPPAEAPSNGQKAYTADPPLTRKLGKHQQKQASYSNTESPSPCEAPQSEEKQHSSATEGGIPKHQRTSVEPHNEVDLGSHEQVQLLKHHHHSFDKSIAGAGVILGGLATTFLVSVFCYIRATGSGKHKAETSVSV